MDNQKSRIFTFLLTLLSKKTLVFIEKTVWFETTDPFLYKNTLFII
jgi:hypothetical protein